MDLPPVEFKPFEVVEERPAPNWSNIPGELLSKFDKLCKEQNEKPIYCETDEPEKKIPYSSLNSYIGTPTSGTSASNYVSPSPSPAPDF
jgi:hypothetical protein